MNGLPIKLDKHTSAGRYRYVRFYIPGCDWHHNLASREAWWVQGMGSYWGASYVSEVGSNVNLVYEAGVTITRSNQFNAATLTLWRNTFVSGGMVDLEPVMGVFVYIEIDLGHSRALDKLGCCLSNPKHGFIVSASNDRKVWTDIGRVHPYRIRQQHNWTMATPKWYMTLADNTGVLLAPKREGPHPYWGIVFDVPYGYLDTMSYTWGSTYAPIQSVVFQDSGGASLHVGGGYNSTSFGGTRNRGGLFDVLGVDGMKWGEGAAYKFPGKINPYQVAITATKGVDRYLVRYATVVYSDDGYSWGEIPLDIPYDTWNTVDYTAGVFTL